MRSTDESKRSEALNDGFERVRERFEAELAEPLQAVEAVRTALDAFALSFEQSLAAEVLTRVELDTQSRVAAAVHAAEQLETATRSLTGHVREYAEQQTTRSAEADAGQLHREFRAINFERIPSDEFRWVAQRFAANARLVQDQLGERGHDAPEVRVIRALTRLCSDRQVEEVFGLCRHHEDNWHGRIEQAEAELADIRSRTRSRLAGHDLGNLKRALRGRPVVVVGGEVRTEKLDRLKRMSGLDIEWVPITFAARLDGRVRHGAVGAVIILDGLVDHSRVATLVDSARRHSVPVTYAGKGGIASVESALIQLDETVA